jgi:hypothetical protein
MPTDSGDDRFDPRYDARFQRGYREGVEDFAVGGSQDDSVPSADAVDRAGPGSRARTADPVVPARTDEPGLAEVTFAQEWPEPGAYVWAAAPGIESGDADGSEVVAARMWPMVALWCVGIGLLLLGVAALMVGIQVNLTMSGGVPGDSPILIISAYAWALAQPALLVGLVTLVGAIALQMIRPQHRADA